MQKRPKPRTPTASRDLKAPSKAGSRQAAAPSHPDFTKILNAAEVQRCFSFAWEHTAYRANLVALRTALGLRDRIALPCDSRPATVTGRDLQRIREEAGRGAGSISNASGAGEIGDSGQGGGTF